MAKFWDGNPSFLVTFVLPGEMRTLLKNAGLLSTPAVIVREADRNRIAQEIYQHLSNYKTRYDLDPYETGATRRQQRIRPPIECFQGDSPSATCLDLALALAAAFEEFRLHPVVVLLQGHALVGYFRDRFDVAQARSPHFPDGVCRDSDVLQRLVVDGQLVVLEATGLADARTTVTNIAEEKEYRGGFGTLTWGHALTIGRQQVLATEPKLYAALDIRRLREHSSPVGVAAGSIEDARPPRGMLPSASLDA